MPNIRPLPLARRGFTLVELLVAVLLLQLLALSVLSTVVAAERASRRLTAAARRDQAHWETYQAAAVTTACRSGSPRTATWSVDPLLPGVPLFLGCGE